MPGLETAVAELANAAGVELTLGRAVPWLSGRGHLNGIVQATAPAPLIAALAEIHRQLVSTARRVRIRSCSTWRSSIHG